MRKTPALISLGLGTAIAVIVLDRPFVREATVAVPQGLANDVRLPSAASSPARARANDARDGRKQVVGAEVQDTREGMEAPTSAPSPIETTPIILADGHLSVRVRSRSLAWVLGEVSRQSGIPITTAPEINEERISVEFQNLTLKEGLQRLVSPWDTFYFYGGGPGEAALRAVWVYPRGNGEGIVPAPPESWASTREIEINLNATRPEDRAAALESLVERKGQQAADAVLSALADSEETNRLRALDTIVNFGLTLPLDPLVGVAQSDASPAVRMRALDAIMYPRLATGVPAAEVTPILENTLSDPEATVRSHAQTLLDELEEAAGSRGNNL